MDGNLLPSFDTGETAQPAAGASPYADLPAERFWRSGVAETNPLIMEKLYRKRFAISATDRIALSLIHI